MKRIKEVEIVKFSRVKTTTKEEELHFVNLKADFRAVTFGTIRVVEVYDKNLRVGEVKITFDKKRNFEPILKAFLDKKLKGSVSSGSVTKQEIINLIYDTYEDLRAN